MISSHLPKSPAERRALYLKLCGLDAPKTQSQATAKRQSKPTPLVLYLTRGSWETSSLLALCRRKLSQDAMQNPNGIQASPSRLLSAAATAMWWRMCGWLRRVMRWSASQAARIHNRVAPKFRVCPEPSETLCGAPPIIYQARTISCDAKWSNRYSKAVCGLLRCP